MTGKALRRRLNNNLLHSGAELAAEQVIVLAHLGHQEGFSQQAIAEILNIDKASTTRIIDALEKKALLKRVPDKTDRRQNMIRMTEKGKKRIIDLQPVVLAMQEEALRGINPADVQKCTDVLWQVWQNLAEE